MSLAVRLSEDLKKALKTGEKDTLAIIRMVRAAIKNREIEKGGSLADEEIFGVLQSMVRQSRESLEQFLKGGRKDLAEKEEKYISVIRSYLPQQLSEGEILEIIREAIGSVGAKGPSDVGSVMKAVIPKVKGRSDGRFVSELVKKELEKAS